MRVLMALLLCLPASRAWGQPAQDAQVLAATRDAVDHLYRQVSAEPLNASVTVDDLLKATRGGAVLLATLERAQQLGAPRWIDPYTCQVKLSIGGAPVASALSKIAATHPDTTPIDAQPLQWILHDWDEKTFIATGTGIRAPDEDEPAGAQAPPRSAPLIERRPSWAPDESESSTTQPTASILVIEQRPRWVREQLAAVGVAREEGSKLRTARLAERNARGRLNEQIMQLPLTERQTIGEVLADHPGLSDAVKRALDRARVYKSDYHADGTVETKISLDLVELWEELTGNRQ